jgi:hypothetical protein
MASRLSVLRTGRALLLRSIIFLRLVLIYVKSLSKPQCLVRLETLGKLEIKLIHLIRSQSRDLPACNIVPQLCLIHRMYLMWVLKHADTRVR